MAFIPVCICFYFSWSHVSSVFRPSTGVVYVIPHCVSFSDRPPHLLNQADMMAWCILADHLPSAQRVFNAHTYKPPTLPEPRWQEQTQLIWSRSAGAWEGRGCIAHTSHMFLLLPASFSVLWSDTVRCYFRVCPGTAPVHWEYSGQTNVDCVVIVWCDQMLSLLLINMSSLWTFFIKNIFVFNLFSLE